METSRNVPHVAAQLIEGVVDTLTGLVGEMKGWKVLTDAPPTLSPIELLALGTIRHAVNKHLMDDHHTLAIAVPIDELETLVATVDRLKATVSA